MVETGLGVNAKDVLSILNTTSLQVNSTTGVTYTVTLLQNELVAGTILSLVIIDEGEKAGSFRTGKTS